jgi:hypothetical protein
VFDAWNEQFREAGAGQAATRLRGAEERSSQGPRAPARHVI